MKIITMALLFTEIKKIMSVGNDTLRISFCKKNKIELCPTLLPTSIHEMCMKDALAFIPLTK